MRRSLGMLAPALLLAAVGCGDDPPGPSGGDTPQFTEVAILTGTSAGGRVTTEPTFLPDRTAVREYVERFRNDGLQGEIVRAAEAAEVPEGRRLAAAVVAIGCEVPTRVVATGGDGATSLRPVLPPPTKHCLAPITSVALVLLPA